mmetsp:Transcript_41562/g.107594  ORF Transcript_41562/g.107594 Transcript_41562/m.107594 type:complete len:172 (-) Transcript_41562:695-1210(-)|eukprot:CAMPEP_0113896314 /NCGR_PEP_ID=MMETSP0780_2-20120614/17937_1 /TAXON_ID=652834 /ORGANISM="Palpitomonas bilix" /LENGTH=171 /DNA_ID=CAMNT_0000887417 /DNA_START=66 /DNA_END=581 /DNA_ORIENTATION=- /assembly_acc=CAM_ASM_000599
MEGPEELPKVEVEGVSLRISRIIEDSSTIFHAIAEASEMATNEEELRRMCLSLLKYKPDLIRQLGADPSVYLEALEAQKLADAGEGVAFLLAQSLQLRICLVNAANPAGSVRWLLPKGKEDDKSLKSIFIYEDQGRFGVLLTDGSYRRKYIAKLIGFSLPAKTAPPPKKGK